ncbi:hypothetical protein OF376_03150 [Ureaplasma miroungigenitalium]|uniref:Uncharacterized protein n=1 Tax=Ureaplasma miroungigenitalium TaxID=1042321 RepID=A0ABT3BP22_9BACT|nr:hypothetical protein [Ureaplasma miroungigenitalium]MCV3728757.1 hypothetical protein [Ureaplasma miroungigenitalium]
MGVNQMAYPFFITLKVISDIEAKGDAEKWFWKTIIITPKTNHSINFAHSSIFNVIDKNYDGTKDKQWESAIDIDNKKIIKDSPKIIDNMRRNNEPNSPGNTNINNNPNITGNKKVNPTLPGNNQEGSPERIVDDIIIEKIKKHYPIDEFPSEEKPSLTVVQRNVLIAVFSVIGAIIFSIALYYLIKFFIRKYGWKFGSTKTKRINQLKVLKKKKRKIIGNNVVFKKRPKYKVKNESMKSLVKRYSDFKNKHINNKFKIMDEREFILKTMYKYQGNDELLKLIEPKPSKTIKKSRFFLKK